MAVDFANPGSKRRLPSMPHWPTIDEITPPTQFTWSGRGPGQAPTEKDARWSTYGFIMACKLFLEAEGDGTRLNVERMREGLAAVTNQADDLPTIEYLQALCSIHQITMPKMKSVG